MLEAVELDINRYELEALLSPERLHRYFNTFPNSEAQALFLYQANIRLSEAFYPSLMLLEVALRNALHKELQIKAQRPDWYEVWRTDIRYKHLYQPKIEEARKVLAKNGKIETPGRVVAELSLGFWVTLFNQKNEKLLWGSLRFAFPNLEKRLRQRNTVAAPINRLHKLRNRTHHYEHILWNPSTHTLDLPRLQSLHKELYSVLDWMSPNLRRHLVGKDRFTEVYEATATHLAIS
jgi:hypothetical protein